MTSDRSQRRTEPLLDQIDAAEASGEWALVSTLAHGVLDLAEDNPEALSYLRAAESAFQVEKASIVLLLLIPLLIPRG